MKIKMKISMSGEEWSAIPFDVVDRPVNEAIRLIAADFAEICEETSADDIKQMEKEMQCQLNLEEAKTTNVIHPETAVAPKAKNKSLLSKILKKN